MADFVHHRVITIVVTSIHDHNTNPYEPFLVFWPKICPTGIPVIIFPKATSIFMWFPRYRQQVVTKWKQNCGSIELYFTLETGVDEMRQNLYNRTHQSKDKDGCTVYLIYRNWRKGKGCSVGLHCIHELCKWHKRIWSRQCRWMLYRIGFSQHMELPTKLRLT